MALTAGALSQVSVTDVGDVLSTAAAVSGTTPYSYQWYRSLVSGFTPGTGNILSGQISFSLTDTGLSPSTTYYYKVVVTDSAGTPAHATASQLAVTTLGVLESKLLRVTQRLFGSTAASGRITQFGSLAAGSRVNTTDPTVIQALSNFLSGWDGAVIGNNSPAIQDMNALFFLFCYQIGYLLQEGVAEWDSGTTYYIGSIVNSSGLLYVSLTDTNLNNAVTDTTNWSGLPARGTQLADLAAAGNVGEFLQTIQTTDSAYGGTTAQYFDLATLSLTAGDWDVTAMATFYNSNVGGITEIKLGISTGSAGNSFSDEHDGVNTFLTDIALGNGLANTVCVPSYRLSLGSTTTVRLKSALQFSVGTPRYAGYRIQARRMR